MRRIVVDAAFCGALILEDEASEKADALLGEALEPGGPILLAPVLWTYEMLNLIRTALKRKRITLKQAAEAVKLLNGIPIRLEDASDPDLRERIFRIALKHDLSPYDAGYFELADRLNVELFSNDRKLADAFSNR